MRKVYSSFMALALVGTTCSSWSAPGDSESTPTTQASSVDGADNIQNPLSQIRVQTWDGPIRGRIGHDGVREFMGIPYAAPPIGPLRWKPPQRPVPWVLPLNTLYPGPVCARTGAGVEDCLTLNVWVPERKSNDPALPVMVYIHGGGFVVGGASNASVLNGTNLARMGNVIVVTINYRLDKFGFLQHTAFKTENPAHPYSGDYGLQDQRLAFTWIKNNIAAFGGDPNNVTAMGNSAGAISICLHMFSPPSKNLFHKAILESGGCTWTQVYAQNGEEKADAFAIAVGCGGGSDVAACMRAKTTAEIVAAVPAGTPPPTILPPGPWTPTVNGFDLIDTPGHLLATGEVMNIPVIQGIMKYEGAFYGMQEKFFAAVQGRPFPPDAARYQTLIRSVFTAPGAADAVLKQFPATSYPTPLAAYTAAVGHGWHNCPQARTARAFVTRGLTTYFYIFNYSGMTYTSPQIPELSGATHTQEAAYIFGNDWAQILPNLQGIIENKDVPVVKSMMKYWSSFARTGSPTNEEGVVWPALTASTTKHLVIDSTLSVQDASALMVPPSMYDEANSRCAFFDGLNP